MRIFMTCGLALTLAACAPAAGSDGDGDGGGTETGGGSTDDSGTGDGTTGTTTDTDTDTDTDSDTDTETGTTSGGANKCDMYLQDCPDGEKCNWKVIGTEIENVCVTVIGDQKIGEPCMHEGIFSGADTCDDAALCYGAVVIGGTWDGICRPYCGGTEMDPTCEDADYVCSRGDLPACLPECDPLLQDCVGAQEMCFYHEPIPGFVCADTSNTADVGEDCLVPFDCRKGLTCQPADKVAGCTGTKCCTEMCDVNAANDCQGAGMGAECVNLMVGGQFEDVGACLLPD